MLRKYRGRLNRTAKARAIGDDPVQLWNYLAERIPTLLKGKAQRDAGILYFLVLAAGTAGDTESAVAALLDDMGWGLDDGSPITTYSVITILRDFRHALDPTGLRSPAPSLATEPFARRILAGLLGDAPQ